MVNNINKENNNYFSLQIIEHFMNNLPKTIKLFFGSPLSSSMKEYIHGW
jgi:hypothetical protein